MSWERVRLGDICIKIGSGATPRGGQENYKTEGISLIRSQNVLDFTFSKHGLAFIDEHQANELSNVEVYEHDILLNITGDSVARVCQVPRNILPARVNQHVAIIRPKSELSEPAFLKYQLLSKEKKDLLLGLSSSGATRNALTKAMIENLEILLPPLEEQRRIASILTALDDKIELNRRMNTTLEGIAGALWEEWFGKYVREGAELPEGWRWGKVGDISVFNKLQIQKSHTFSSLNYIEISEVEKGRVNNIQSFERGTEPSRAKRRIQHGDIIISTVRPDRGSYFLAQFPTENTVVSTGFAVFTATLVPYSFLYYYLTSQSMLEYYGLVADGGAYPAINPVIIANIEIIIPTEDILAKFHQKTEAIYSKIHQNQLEITTLTHLRDTLLPRLMRGE